MPWLSQHLIRNIRKKNSVFRAVKSHDPQKWEKYKKLRNEVVLLMRETNTSYFARIDPSSPKYFRKAVRYLKTDRSSLPPLRHCNEVAESSSAKANMLNNLFTECFNVSVPPLKDSDANSISGAEGSCPENPLCSVEEEVDLIISLDPTKANGPDGISAFMLKGVAHSISPSLTKLFNMSRLLSSVLQIVIYCSNTQVKESY